MADKEGYQHSQYLMQVTVDDGYNDYIKMGQLLKDFLASSDALGYSDWYIPTQGQIALMYVYQSDINTALTAMGGTTFQSGAYWSSNERDEENGQYVSMVSGIVYYYYKNDFNCVRFIRDLQ